METSQVFEQIREVGIVPVIRASSPQEAHLAIEAVRAGGIPIVEITMTVPGALGVIADVAHSSAGTVLVGAGTVLDAEAAEKCIDAGAEFLVSPGFDRATIEVAKRRGKLIMAGALTPTEVITAWKAGADIVKVFPCGSVGGPKYIKALRGPLPQVPLVPTGGVNLSTAADFLKAGAVALGIGGELVSADAIKNRDAASITELAHKYIGIVRETRGTAALAAR